MSLQIQLLGRWVSRALLGTALLAAPALAVAQSAGPADAPDSALDHGTFQFDGDVRGGLRQLWSASIAAKAERVACMDAHVDQGVVHITKVEVLETEAADSANINAEASLRKCAPPMWAGTVHTHIAKFDGQPYIIFSANDRRVMEKWRSMWKAPGIFCILYSETEANCEAGYRLSGQALYSYAPRLDADILR